MTIDEARKLLDAAEVFFECEDGESQFMQMLNLSDTFAWGCADGEKVADDELVEVARLFWHYGYCGLLYWASTKRDGERAEFADVNRFIDFVREEEAIRNQEPSDSRRAYLKREYTIGR